MRKDTIPSLKVKISRYIDSKKQIDEGKIATIAAIATLGTMSWPAVIALYYRSWHKKDSQTRSEQAKELQTIINSNRTDYIDSKTTGKLDELIQVLERSNSTTLLSYANQYRSILNRDSPEHGACGPSLELT